MATGMRLIYCGTALVLGKEPISAPAMLMKERMYLTRLTSMDFTLSWRKIELLQS